MRREYSEFPRWMILFYFFAGAYYLIEDKGSLPSMNDFISDPSWIIYWVIAVACIIGLYAYSKGNATGKRAVLRVSLQEGVWVEVFKPTTCKKDALKGHARIPITLRTGTRGIIHQAAGNYPGDCSVTLWVGDNWASSHGFVEHYDDGSNRPPLAFNVEKIENLKILDSVHNSTRKPTEKKRKLHLSCRE